MASRILSSSPDGRSPISRSSRGSGSDYESAASDEAASPQTQRTHPSGKKSTVVCHSQHRISVGSAFRVHTLLFRGSRQLVRYRAAHPQRP